MKTYLICYDIADPKRLGRVHRICRNYAIPVQYSVFLGELSREQLEQLLSVLEETISSKEDDVRLYPLEPRQQPVFMGPEEGADTWTLLTGRTLFDNLLQERRRAGKTDSK